MEFSPVLAFLTHFLAGIGYVALFVFIYIRVTPYAEFKLIRQGNASAAISLGGAMIGFCLPLAKAIAQSLSAVDLFIWATVALTAQILAFVLFIRLLPALARQVEGDRIAKSVLLAVVSVAIGLINAASMTE